MLCDVAVVQQRPGSRTSTNCSYAEIGFYRGAFLKESCYGDHCSVVAVTGFPSQTPFSPFRILANDLGCSACVSLRGPWDLFWCPLCLIIIYSQNRTVYSSTTKTDTNNHSTAHSPSTPQTATTPPPTPTGGSTAIPTPPPSHALSLPR